VTETLLSFDGLAVQLGGILNSLCVGDFEEEERFDKVYREGDIRLNC
jgi:hypothetical protein